VSLAQTLGRLVGHITGRLGPAGTVVVGAVGLALLGVFL
jgi:hypothetical protein